MPGEHPRHPGHRVVHVHRTHSGLHGPEDRLRRRHHPRPARQRRPHPGHRPHFTRIFPPHIRKAITARDQGCAFPACTIPATWCEAHHITYWSHGGPTGTDNGTFLCSHHHHLIHKENWTIQVKTGIPWFIPPPHIDPHQKPRRNHDRT
ncbi:HNH endonuclease signature motif containing protein [Arthrobacter oryzae]|uniref:HNH endonuclease signature motif containing protein n=1 Tax=Arthrobacter oryzae TaxID=409290 RepID=UPI003593E7F2